MSLEYKTIVGGLIFMVLLNLVMGLVVNPDTIEGFDEKAVIREWSDGISSFSFISFTSRVLLNVANNVFSVFGVNLIASILLLPWWLNTLLILYNLIIVFAVIFYLIDRLWIG